ncbi:MAG: DUF1501 domain-containing protein [Planctomycetaceae bacterium]|nr:DUF1501 domain-containing protein [Planctomycetaceae bacterium]
MEPADPRITSRRGFLSRAALGAAGVPLASQLAMCARAFGGRALEPQPGTHPARAQQLIFVFLTGGFSQVDTFDDKPQLRKDHGKPVPGESLREVTTQPLNGSPFKFWPRGESGLVISELFPLLGDRADDLCVIRTLHTDILEHFQAVLAMHTGSATVPLPSLGAWLSYGLGTLNPNLPPYVVLCEKLPYAGSQVWDSNFLPPEHQGMRLVPGKQPSPHLSSPAPTATLAELEARMLADVNALHAEARGNDPNLAARIHSFHTARGMMRVAPAVFDLGDETQATRDMYGLPDGDNESFAWQCLVARRLVEQGVRTVELIDTGASNNWDSHGDMQDHRPKAQRVDRALAALLTDLKQRGLWDNTLVAICTEFGRSPWDPGKGRNHWHRAFSSLLAGGAIKGGTAYGVTDEYGALPIENPVHVHDYHATILHAMGIDHKQLTYRYAGRDFRLTDVAGNVLHDVLA